MYVFNVVQSLIQALFDFFHSLGINNIFQMRKLLKCVN